MTDSQNAQVEDLFDQLCDADAASREAVLSAIDDVEVRDEVMSLLQHAEPSAANVETVVNAMMQGAAFSGAFADRAIGPGTRFERYRIQEKLGQGGMGDVYLATRENDFHKQVALKIVRNGLDSAFARERFQQERQTLASLEHPFIARLLDGGEAENGCPYLVLELVDGVPIDTYCEGRSRDEILKLFLKVCEAVEYAHRNLVIHRDLKPANILVTADGDPKLLDFGIAKLLDANAVQTVVLALTPQYASPEQVRGEPISTASDVYSLAVVLYQLLTGRKPYHFETSTALEIERVVCLDPPTQPGLGNELDDILMMALRKEPARRYASVVELAQDITRFLEGRPVLAAPDTFLYRSRKFIGRNRIAIVAVAAIILVLTGGLLSTVYQMRRAERQQHEAEKQRHEAEQRFQQVRKLSNTFLFDINDRLIDIAGTTSTRAFVLKTAQTYLDDLARSPGKDPDLQAELAQAYNRLADAQAGANKANLGDVAGAEASHRRSIALYEGLARQDPKYTVDAVAGWRLLARFYIYHDRLVDASQALGRAVALAAPLRQDHSSRALLELASLSSTQAQAAEQHFDADAQVVAERHAMKYLEAAARVASAQEQGAIAAQLGGTHMELGRGYFNRTDMTSAESEYVLARQYNARALALAPQSQRARAFYVNTLFNLMTLYNTDTEPSMDKPQAAGPYAREAIALIEPMVAADANDINSKMNYVVLLIGDARSQAESDTRTALKQALHAAELWSSLSQRPGLTGAQLSIGLDDQRSIVFLLARLGARKQARELADNLLRARRKQLSVFPPTDDNYWFLTYDLQAAAEAARASGDRAAADRMLEEAVRIAAPFAAAASQQTTPAFFASRLYRALANRRAAEGKCAEAREWQQKDKAVWAPLAPKFPYAAHQLLHTDQPACPA